MPKIKKGFNPTNIREKGDVSMKDEEGCVGFGPGNLDSLTYPMRLSCYDL